MHSIHLPYAALGQPGPGGVVPAVLRAVPARHADHCIRARGPHFHCLGSGEALGRVTPKSQLTNSHLCIDSECVTPPGGWFSKSASPNIRRGQKKGIFLPRAARLCPEVPSHSSGTTAGLSCATQCLPSAGRQRVHGSSRQAPALPCCIPGKKPSGEGRGRITEVRVSAWKGWRGTVLLCCRATCGQAAGGPPAEPVPWDPHTT